MIEVKGLSKMFQSREGQEPVQALRDVDLTVGDNEFLTVLGPSGCGKTTLLRNIAGLVPWDEGEILVDGQPVTGPSADRAMVFQNFALMPWASVLSNVTIGLEIRGDPKAERDARAMELLELVGLKGFERDFRANSPAACSSASDSREPSPSTPRRC